MCTRDDLLGSALLNSSGTTRTQNDKTRPSTLTDTTDKLPSSALLNLGDRTEQTDKSPSSALLNLGESDLRQLDWMEGQHATAGASCSSALLNMHKAPDSGTLDDTKPATTSNIREVELFSAPQEHRSSLVVPARINGKDVLAIVDTAAQVSVLSKDFVNQSLPALVLTDPVILGGASKGSRFRANHARNVEVALGSSTFIWDVVVAPINDPFILGLDFLQHHEVLIDLSQKSLQIKDEIIMAKLLRSGGGLKPVRKVTLQEKCAVPPRSSRQCMACVDDLAPVTAPELMISPVGHHGGLLIPHMVVRAVSEVPILITNASSEPALLRKGHLVGYATEAEVLEEDSDLPAEVRQVATQPDTPLPDHLTELRNRCCANLSESQAALLTALLTEYQDVFAKDDLDLGKFSGIKHHINVGDAKPIRQGLRRTPLGFENEEEAHLQDMLDRGIIKPSASDWASAPVLVRKKCGAVRYCIDFRALNKVTQKDAYPLPLMESCIDALHGTQFMSSMDLASGYWQIEIAEEDRPKTAFITKYGLFEHDRMAFGLCNAPATFQRAMQLVLQGLLWKDCLAYLDDVIVLGKSFEDHLQKLTMVLDRFRYHNLKLKPKKCALFQEEVQFLGHVVSRSGVAVNPDHIKAVSEWPTPRTTTHVESFLGFVNYHREHIPGLAGMAVPLYEITGPKAKFEWKAEHQEAFEKIKRALVSSAVLSYPDPDPSCMFILDVDASDRALGAELLQLQDGKEKVISYASKVLTPAQRRYCTTRKELLAVITFTRQYRHYLLGRKFTVRTDHNSLTWLLRFRCIEGQLARWLEELAQYDMNIEHRPGKKHGNADGLSRIPEELHSCDCYQAGVTPDSLPCGGCPYCQRAHQQWSRFEQDVDDVIPLAIRSITAPPVKTDNSLVNWLEPYSMEEIRQKQLEDPDLAAVHEFMQSPKEESGKLFLQSAAVKHWWVCRKQLVEEGGILYYEWQSETGPILQLLVPSTLKEEALNACHDSMIGGHLGEKKTLGKLKRRFTWYGMSKDCKLHCRTCATCKRNKKARVKPRAALGQYHAGVPMERVHMDILGPLTPSEKGNVYILVLICQFTKWIEIFPLPSQTAEDVAEAALNGFISRFGCPLQIHTDQGKNFDGNLFKAFCDLLQITKTRTTPYRPCANGQVERYNRLILQMVRCFVQGHHRDWDEHLPILAGAIRAMENRQTGFTPNMMMLGREVNQPIDLLVGTAGTMQERSEPAEYVKKLQQVMTKAHQLARKSIQTAQLRQKRDYDLKLNQNAFSVGDMVYQLNSASRIGVSNKLKSPWKGPYLVSEVLSPVLYRLRDRRRESVVHHDRLTLCEDRIIPLWMRRLRNQVLGEEFVQLAEDEEEEDMELDSLFRMAPTNRRTGAASTKRPANPDSALLNQGDPARSTEDEEEEDDDDADETGDPPQPNSQSHPPDIPLSTANPISKVSGRTRRLPKKLDGYDLS